MSDRKTWVEITSVLHGHGGPGWELGTCLWSPAANQHGADRYALMRELRTGDEVLHLVKNRWPDGKEERRLVGRSVVASPFVTRTDEPPNPGDWAGRPAYYRIDLDEYEEFATMPSIDDFIAENPERLRAEADAADGYPMPRYGDGVRIATGLYLRRCTPWLRDELLARALGAAGDIASLRRRRAFRRADPVGEYKRADENQSRAPGSVMRKDPDAFERGCRGHARTQNLLAEFLVARGLTPGSPTGDANFDVAWRLPSGLAIAEVKSVTVENETSQLRLGLGQLLHYRYLLSAEHVVLTVLVAERQPLDDDWLDIASSAGVLLTWAPDFPGLDLAIAAHMR